MDSKLKEKLLYMLILDLSVKLVLPNGSQT